MRFLNRWKELAAAAAAAALLLLSFLCALVALWRFKYRALNTPVYLSEFYSDQVDEFTSNLLAVQNYARSLEEPYQSLVKRNNSISRLHKAAIVLLIIGTSIVLCSVLLTTLAPAILGVFMLA